MTLTDIRDLILVYDGLRDIERCIVLLCNQDMAIGYEDGALGKLSRIYDVIYRNSALYDPEVDIDEARDSEGRNLIDILEMDVNAEERAKMLLK